jgi:hypothetical protein
MQSRRSLIFSMATDRAKIEYAKKPLRRKYTGADLTSGPIVAGKYYQFRSSKAATILSQRARHRIAQAIRGKRMARRPSGLTAAR